MVERLPLVNSGLYRYIHESNTHTHTHTSHIQRKIGNQEQKERRMEEERTKFSTIIEEKIMCNSNIQQRASLQNIFHEKLSDFNKNK